MGTARLHVKITGRVQGVGFRPMVYRYAKEHGVSGWVSNGPEGVTIEAEAERERLDSFLAHVRNGLPPSASIRSMQVRSVSPRHDAQGFQIRESRPASRVLSEALSPPDLALCGNCRREMRDPADRRLRYPFTNCTDCGPRFSIVMTLPYDRPYTTMDRFTICPACDAEYHDPANRRFHAQPNACPVCGPAVFWHDPSSDAGRSGNTAILQAAAFLADGKIVAIQSIGGFHLACDASRRDTVDQLRLRKHRPHKPLAVMAAGLDTAIRAGVIESPSPAIGDLLNSAAAPVVMAPSRSLWLSWLAPGLRTIGLVLPYTPLHLTLFDVLADMDGPDVLVMTSGNPPGDPICRDPADAVAQLTPIADGFLTHNRPIHNRCDDSVVAVRGTTAHVIRRARGYVPEPVRLDKSAPTIFAAGADLKSAACITRGGDAFLTQYIGDLMSEANGLFYIEAVRRLSDFLCVRPSIVVRDAHPDFASSRLAGQLADEWRIGQRARHAVQHHHAHIAATLAEHGVDGPVIGVSFDGVGFGTDGTLWGGEWLAVDGASFSRIAHLHAVPQPGGDQATVQIWRMAVSHLHAALGEAEAGRASRRIFSEVDSHDIESTRIICGRPNLAIGTSSVGRLFDAVSAIAGLRTEVSYESQAAMEFEASFDAAADGSYEFDITRSETGWVLEAAPVIRRAAEDRLAGFPAGVISARFHRGLAAIVVEMCRILRTEGHPSRVALGGGVFQNMKLIDLLEPALQSAGFDVFVPRKIPANDGGIALGQAWIAARLHAAGGN